MSGGIVSGWPRAKNNHCLPVSTCQRVGNEGRWLVHQPKKMHVKFHPGRLLCGFLYNAFANDMRSYSHMPNRIIAYASLVIGVARNYSYRRTMQRLSLPSSCPRLISPTKKKSELFSGFSVAKVRGGGEGEFQNHRSFCTTGYAKVAKTADARRDWFLLNIWIRMQRLRLLRAAFPRFLKPKHCLRMFHIVWHVTLRVRQKGVLWPLSQQLRHVGAREPSARSRNLCRIVARSFHGMVVMHFGYTRLLWCSPIVEKGVLCSK